MIYFQNLFIIPNRNPIAIKQELLPSYSPSAWEPLFCILFQGTTYLGRTSHKGNHVMLVFGVWSVSLSMCSRSIHVKLKQVSEFVLFMAEYYSTVFCFFFLKLPNSGDELAGVQLKEKDGQGWNESCGDGRKGKSK